MTFQLLLKMEHYGSGSNNMLQLIFVQFYKNFCSQISKYKSICNTKTD